MQKEVYERGLITGQAFAARTPVSGRLVAVLDAEATGRGLNLISPLSRAVVKHEIHELIVTPEPSAGPGSVVNDIAYLGFFEVEEGGIILVGDYLDVAGRRIGQVAGFDLTHFPNHMNIVVRGVEVATGRGLRLELGDVVSFDGGV
ncbi:MAG: DUF6917 domain-containing protein [Chloroflexota bacterium]